MAAGKLSGLQRQVLSLYRRCLREARRKPDESRRRFEEFARQEFRRNLDVDRRDFSTVEFLLRKGGRMVDVYSAEGVKDVHG